MKANKKIAGLNLSIEVTFSKNTHAAKSTSSTVALTRTVDLDAPGAKFGVGVGEFRQPPNGEVERLNDHGGQARRPHSVFPRPRRQTDHASWPPPTIVRRH
jgi:hypothetical protein